MMGFLHSVQSLGTVDGPGVRAVAFLSGCPLRCICCHNPDTWEPSGEEVTPGELAGRLLRFLPYFKETGGVTLSGGEPLLQAAFATELFTILRKQGVHTALDTSGCLPQGDGVRELLAVTDLVILDMKYTDPDDYLRYTGCRMETVLAFLSLLEERAIPTWLRQVIIPGINNRGSQVLRLRSLAAKYSCVKRVELLPFRKLCSEKYKALGIPFRLEGTPEEDAAELAELQSLLT